VLFFIGFDKLKGIWEAGSFEMAIQQQKLSEKGDGGILN
jgi:hypothetical protein